MTSELKPWRYVIKHGPEGESSYAWVYDDLGEMVGTMKTHKAKKIVDTMNTRAVPDVPELVAVSHEVFYAPTREWRKTVEPEYYRKNGDLVRDLIDKSKAAAIIAALTERLKNTETAMGSIIDERIEATKRAEAAEAKLAKYEAQEPAAYTLIFRKSYGVNTETTFKKFEDAEKYAIRCELPLSSIIPLYASPAPAADLKARK